MNVSDDARENSSAALLPGPCTICSLTSNNNQIPRMDSQYSKYHYLWVPFYFHNSFILEKDKTRDEGLTSSSSCLLQHLQQAALLPVQAGRSASHRGGGEDLHLSQAGSESLRTQPSSAPGQKKKYTKCYLTSQSCSKQSWTLGWNLTHRHRKWFQASSLTRCFIKYTNYSFHVTLQFVISGKSNPARRTCGAAPPWGGSECSLQRVGADVGSVVQDGLGNLLDVGIVVLGRVCTQCFTKTALVLSN